MRSSVTRRVLSAAGLAAIGAGVIGLVVACEHEHYWRGGHAHSGHAEYHAGEDAHGEGEEGKARFAEWDSRAREAKELAEATARSAGCISCHGETDDPDMHANSPLKISCVDCHGGDGSVMSTMSAPGRPGEAGTPIEDEGYLKAMHAAHVRPRNAEAWYGAQLTGSEVERKFGEHAHEDPTKLHDSRNPEISYALLNQESPEFTRFINPGDLRVAHLACGSCHADTVAKVRHSMMATGQQLWGAALYNNGAIPNKIPRFGESYSMHGEPQRVQGVITDVKAGDDGWRVKVRMPTKEEMKKKGVIAYLDPLAVWNITQPGNILRIFERGQRLPNPSIGEQSPLVEPGKPDKQLSPRGLGTLLRVDPVFIGLQKTRLLDPLLSFLGTNDHPGDFRMSGCTACHVVYANDRDTFNSGPYAQYGNMGQSQTKDPTISKADSGHPIRHVLTNAIPTSQCIVCHMHPGTQYANTYAGNLWWDNESDAEFMYPSETREPTAEQEWKSQRHNPEAASMRGLWANLHPDAVSHTGETSGEDFLERSGTPRTGKRADEDGAVLNDRTKHTQFQDFHGHGWMFRNVYKKDRQGNMLTASDEKIAPDDPDKWGKAVHLKDIHLEKGMHCVDCHFSQDAHGDGKLYGEVRNAIEITCVDCHGSYESYATLRTTGPAAPEGGTNLEELSARNAEGEVALRFEWDKRKDGTRRLVQRSVVTPGLEWEVVQTLDTVNPNSQWSKDNPSSAKLSRYAKTVRKERGADGSIAWGDLPAEGWASNDLAHNGNELECYTCHTSWMTSCFGCHLTMKANQRTPMLHNESKYTRNYTNYNFQVLRDDVYMLGRDSTVKGGRIVPVRSSSAVTVASQNAAREWIYHQQQTISSEGYSGQAFNPHFPHATGGVGTTKRCTDCHVSEANDNNAWMAQLLLQGTNFVNFLGRYVYVATGSEGLEAVAVTEHEEPQAVYGSHLHDMAYPDQAKAFAAGNRQLHESYHHGAEGVLGFGGGEILDLQLRGEYLYAARGSSGFYIFDVANIDNKGFSERITTAPVSPLGQKLGFDTSYAVAVASPSTLAVDPARWRYTEDAGAPRKIGLDEPEEHHLNQEQRVHPMYAYLYIADRDEGLIMTFAGTLLDGDPQNNFMERATLKDGTTAFNPQGLLSGMTNLTLAGHYVYATATAGLVVIDVDDPLDPKVVATVGSDVLNMPQGVAVQFRYAFVTDAEGLKVIDVTDPTRPAAVSGAQVALGDAHRLYVARTYCFVANGREGLAIIDVTNPEKPALQQNFTADGRLTDCRDVKVGMNYASLYAYVADGHNGLRVIQLMGPNTTAQFRGFSPPLEPSLIATYHTHGPALAVSKGLDRDRAVDETGNQVAVFGRLGARPLRLEEQQEMYLHNGSVFKVTDDPKSEPMPWTFKSKEDEQKEEGGRGRRRGR